MGHALLKSRRRRLHATRMLSAAMTAAFLILAGCVPFFDDPRSELDPVQRDTTLAALPDSENTPVLRDHILESFGSFGCVSCPDAESKLLPYIHPELGFKGYNPRLAIVNYHVKFGSINDPWVTPATQARYDRSFANSLPQVTLDGSNAPFGIPEVDANYNQGQYDTLIARLKIQDSLTYLDLRIDTSGLAYDSAAQSLHFKFTVSNRSLNATGDLAFSALAVKNIPALIPIYADPWEVIVAQTTNQDSTDHPMILNGLTPLTAKTFSVSLQIASEASKQVAPSPIENPADYGIIVLAENDEGIIQNVVFYRYRPMSLPSD